MGRLVVGCSIFGTSTANRAPFRRWNFSRTTLGCRPVPLLTQNSGLSDVASVRRASIQLVGCRSDGYSSDTPHRFL